MLLTLQTPFPALSNLAKKLGCINYPDEECLPAKAAGLIPVRQAKTISLTKTSEPLAMMKKLSCFARIRRERVAHLDLSVAYVKTEVAAYAGPHSIETKISFIHSTNNLTIRQSSGKIHFFDCQEPYSFVHGSTVPAGIHTI